MLDGLVLRNTVIANAFDRCAISMPCHGPGEPPVGLMLIGETMGDKRLFQISFAVEAATAWQQGLIHHVVSDGLKW